MMMQIMQKKSENCKTAEAAARLSHHWPVEGHDCECDGEGKVLFEDGIILPVPCNCDREKER